MFSEGSKKPTTRSISSEHPDFYKLPESSKKIILILRKTGLEYLNQTQGLSLKAIKQIKNEYRDALSNAKINKETIQIV